MVRTLGRVRATPSTGKGVVPAGAKSAKTDASSRSCRLEPAELELLVLLLLLLAEDEREMEQNEVPAAAAATTEGKGRAVGIEVADEAPRGRAVSSCRRAKR